MLGRTSTMKNIILLLIAASSIAYAQETRRVPVLSWSDNSTNETGFEIERDDDQNSIGEWNTIATVGAGVEEFVDESVQAGRVYTYRVRAVNGFGVSEYTNMATFDTTGDGKPPDPPSGLEISETIIAIDSEGP